MQASESGIQVCSGTRCKVGARSLRHCSGDGKFRPYIHIRKSLAGTSPLCLERFSAMDMEIDDEEAPPLLVTDDAPDASFTVATELEELNVTKVPITIVTGRLSHRKLVSHV